MIGQGNFSLYLSIHTRRVPHTQVLSQVSGPMSFPGSTPILLVGTTPVLAGGVPQDKVRPTGSGVPPSQDWGTPLGQVTLRVVRLLQFPAGEPSCKSKLRLV